MREARLSLTRPRDVALFSGATVLGLALTFLTGVVAARWLGPEAYGEVSLVRSVYTLLAILAPLGLDVALLRHLGETAGDDPARALARVRRFRIICAAMNLAVLAAAALWVGPWLEAHAYRQPGFAILLALALLALPFAGDAAILSATLRALGSVTVQNLAVLVLQPLVRTAALLALLAAGFGPQGVVIATTLGAVTASGALAFGLARLQRWAEIGGVALAAEDRAAVPAVLRYSLWMAGLLLLNNGVRMLDLLALGRFRPPEEVGRYAALAAIAAMVAVPAQALSQTLAPQVARLHAAGDIDGMRAALGDYLRRAVLLCSPIFAGVAAFGPWLDLLFGARYRFGGDLSLLLAALYLVVGCLGQMGVSLTMTGRHRREFVVLSLGAALAAGLCWALTPRFGGVGAGLGVLAGALVLNGARMALSAQLLGGFGLRWADGIVPPAACVAWAFGVRAVMDRAFPHAWPTALAGGAILLAGFAALYAGLLSPEERRALVGASWRR